MFNLFKHKAEKVEVLGYEERIKRLELRIGALENEIINLSGAVSILRSKFIKRNLQIEETQKPKDLYNGMLLAE